jgi:hypothetical protein
MNTIRKTSPKVQKIEIRGEGFGIASPDEVERRARELALIDGRNEVTDADRQEARDEFQNRDLPEAVTEDGPPALGGSRDPSEPLSDPGRQSPNHGDLDDDTALERLALEGVEEAQHEQMMTSRNTVDEPLRSRPKKQKSRP